MSSILEINSTIPNELVFCKKLLKWLNNCDVKTHPIASLTALITIASAITARGYYGHTNASTTLFIVLISKTGSGKNLVVKAPSNIMGLLGQENKIIPSKISSEGAMDDIFKTQTSAIHVIDEFGDQLAHMIGDTGGYLKVVSAKMKSLYGMTNGIYYSGRYSSAGGKQKTNKSWTLKRPCYGLTGLTTQQQLLSQLSDTMLHDGFLNRFIIFNGQEIKPRFNDFPEYELPSELLEHLKSIKMTNFYREDEESEEDMNEQLKSHGIDFFKDDEKVTIPLSKEAHYYYSKVIGDADIENTDIYKYCLDDEAEIKRAISVRWRENSIRLATALVALEKLEEVPLCILEWSYKLVKNSSLNFLALFQNDAPETKYEILKNKAINWFKKQDENKYVSLSYLAQNARPFSSIKSKERNDLLDDLVESGIIIKKIDDSQSFKLAS